MKFALHLLTFLLLFNLVSTAQSYREALDLFNKNKRTEAKVVLSKITKDNKEYTDAQLLQTLIAIDNGHIDEAFSYFTLFFQQHPNPYPYLYALWSRGIWNTSSEKSTDNAKKIIDIVIN